METSDHGGGNSKAGRSRARVDAGDGVGLLGLMVACAFMLGRLLQPGTIPYAHDTLTHDFPILWWCWEATREAGALALWNPHLQNGLPTIGSFAWCPFLPTAWLMGVSLEGGFRLQWWLALVTAGAGMAVWGSAVGLGRTARWTAGLALALSGHLVTLASAGHLQKVLAIAWLPWALAAVEWAFAPVDEHEEEIRRRGRMGRAWTGGLAAGCAVGFQLLASHTQIAWITAGLVASRALWMAAGGLGSRGEMPGVASRSGCMTRRMAAFGVGALVAGGLISAAQLVPALETARLSNRAAGVPLEEAVLTSYPPFELLEWVFPRFLGDSVREGWGVYRGEWGSERIVTDYAGCGVIVLALSAWGWRGRRRALRSWLLAVSAGALVLALGRFTPVYAAAWHWLPGLNRFRSPGTQMVVTAFGFAAFAGLGMEALLGRTAQPGPAARRVVGSILALGAGLIPLGLVLLGRAKSGAGWSPGDPQALQILFVSMGGSCLWGGCFAGALGLALAVRGGGGVPGRRVVVRGALMMLPVGILAGDLGVRLQPFLSPEPLPPYKQYLTQTPSDLVVARDSRRPRRLIEPGNELTLRPMMHGIGVPLGYHPVSYAAMHETMEALGLDSPALRQVWGLRFVRQPGARPPDDLTTWTALLHAPGWTLWRDEHAGPFVRAAGGVLNAGARGERTALAGWNALEQPMDRGRPALVNEETAQSVRGWMEREGSYGVQTLVAEVEEGVGDGRSWIRRLVAPRSLEDLDEKARARDRAQGGRRDERPTTDTLGEPEIGWRAAYAPMRRTEAALPAGGEGFAATVIEEAAGRWVIRMESQRPEWVVLSLPPAPGWSALRFDEWSEAERASEAGSRQERGRESGRALPLWRADGCATLMPWPGGEGFVVLLYEPWSHRLGFFLSLLGVFAGGAMAAFGVGWRSKNRRALA